MMHARKGDSGFTLLEVLLVIMLMAVLSVVVVVKLTATSKRHQIQDVLEEIQLFDHLTRLDARRSNRPSTITFNLDRQEIQRRDALTQEPRGKAYQFPSGYRVDEVLTSNSTPSVRETSLPCSVSGVTPSYAVCVRGPAKQESWVLIVGVSQQAFVYPDAATVHEILGAANGGK